MRHVEDDQPLDALPVAQCGVPGDGAAPVVPDEHGAPRAGGGNQAGDVRYEVRH